MKKNVLIVGCGNMGAFYDLNDFNLEHPRSHLTAFLGHSEFEIKGLVDPDASKLEKICQKVGPLNCYKNISEIPSDVHFDVVTIAAATPVRIEIISQLAARTKLFFCEKPLASHLAEAVKIQSVLNSHPNQKLVLNYSRRWNETLQNLAERIQKKEFGVFKKVNTVYTKGFTNNGSHQIDLLHMLGCASQSVKALGHAVQDGFFEPTFSFELEQLGPNGEAFVSTHQALNYHEYTVFELDLLFSHGRIRLHNGGDSIDVYKPQADTQYTDYRFLTQTEEHVGTQKHMLKNAVSQINSILNGSSLSNCGLEAGLKSLKVCEALLASFQNDLKKTAVSL